MLITAACIAPAFGTPPSDLGTTVEIKNFSTGQCLDVLNNSIYPQVGVATTPCNGGANQKWLVRYHPSCLNSSTGQMTCWDYIFINLRSGLCLDVPGGIPSNGLQQFSCNYGNNQRFKVTWRYPLSLGGTHVASYATTDSSGQPTAKVFSTGPNTNVSLGAGQPGLDNPLNYWNGIPR
jgi:hypothetical protein